MKKLTKICATLLAVVMAASLIGCSNSGAANKKVKVIDIQLTQEEYAFGVEKDNDELLAKVNEYIAQIKKRRHL